VGAPGSRSGWRTGGRFVAALMALIVAPVLLGEIACYPGRAAVREIRTQAQVGMARGQVDSIVSGALRGRGLWVYRSTRAPELVVIQTHAGLASLWVLRMRFSAGVLAGITVGTDDGPSDPEGLAANGGS
jgi:hypothetical protein